MNLIIKHVAKTLEERMENMRQQDKLDGKTTATNYDYLRWALEEMGENDGLLLDIQETTHN